LAPRPSQQHRQLKGRRLYKIGLCTSTRWSPGTWQLLLMFHQDRVNRLPEQTQRRTYGCAPLALRRVGAKNEVFAGRVSPNKASGTRPTRLNVRSTCSNHIYIYCSSIPPPTTQYKRAILYDTYTIYTLAGGKPAMSLFIHPPSKSLSSTAVEGLSSTRLLLFNSLDSPFTAYCPPLFTKDLD